MCERSEELLLKALEEQQAMIKYLKNIVKLLHKALTVSNQKQAAAEFGRMLHRAGIL